MGNTLTSSSIIPNRHHLVTISNNSPQSESEVADESTTTRSSSTEDDKCLYRYELVSDKLINPKLLLSLPANSPDPNTENNHDGGKVVVGPDHNVYVAIGDVGGHIGASFRMYKMDSHLMGLVVY